MSVNSKIVKSESDSKEYRLVTLNNGLRALLVADLKGVDLSATLTSSVDSASANEDFTDSESDYASESDYESEEFEGPSSDEEEARKSCEQRKKKQAAAALCVNVGSFSDPPDIPGLAHFLEHMVFMGSEKYPNENKFDAFICRHGGTDNAHTDCERTIFQFEIQPEYFCDALHIWAQFFIAPLLKYDSIKREVKAVDAEHDMALNNDNCRKEQLFGSYAFPKGHPMAKFMWGNKKSLYDIPAKNGIDVYGALKNFHKKYYRAKYMTLVVQSPEQLDKLEEWVRNIFEEIPSTDEGLPVLSYNLPNIPPFQLIKIAPVKNTQELHLVWVLPSQQQFYRTKPLHYLSWLIGHEGKGSILSLLKKKQLALSLVCGNEGSGFDHNCAGSLFNICITLTDEGFSRYCEVLDIVFQYLVMIKENGVSERIFKEIQQIEDIDFRFSEEESPMENVVDLSENMQLYPEEEILTGDELLFDFDPTCINDAMSRLKRDECVVFLSSQSFKKMKNTEKEPWFGTRYLTSEISEEWQTKWSQTDGNIAISEDLHLPRPNMFIAKNFIMKSGPEDSGSSVDNLKYPRLISSDKEYKVWFRQDDIFKLPKASIRIRLVNPLVYQSPQENVCLELFVHLLVHNLAEVAYDADAASLTYGAESCENGGLVLKFSGYDDNLAVLVDTVATYLAEFRTTQEDFDQRLIQHKRSYYNSLIKPAKLAKMLRLNILKKTGWSPVDKYNACQSLNYSDFLKFVENFFSSMYIESLVQGNYTENEANSIIAAFVEKFKCHALTNDRIIQQRIIKLEETKVCKVSGINNTDENSMVVMYFQGGPYTVKNGALLRLLEAIMEEPCFDILRTKQQLGYSVYVQHLLTGGILGLSVNVATQRSKFSVEETMTRIVDFAKKKMDRIVKKMPKKVFDAQLKSLIAVLRNDDTHLGEEVSRNWSEIVSRKYNFDRREKEMTYLETCSHADFKNFYAEFCARNNKVLHVQVQGSENSGNKQSSDTDRKYSGSGEAFSSSSKIVLDFHDSKDSESHNITNIDRFKNSCSCFSVVNEISE